MLYNLNKSIKEINMNSIKVIKKSISAGAFGVTMLATKAFAQSSQVTNGLDSVTPTDIVSNGTTLQQYIQIVINVLLGAIGTVAIIMLIIGGFRYVLSQGDEKATKGAKDTILFAIVGIVVAILAYAIVTFVIGQFATR